MRILVVTNYYPPSKYGWGYMQLCEEVTSGLANKGHEITVLTSTQVDGAEIPRSYPVHRWLTIEPDWLGRKLAAVQFFVGRKRREKQAIVRSQRLIDEFKPQVMLVWHLIGLPKAVFQAVEQRRDCAVAYYCADYSPELPDEYLDYWQAMPVHPLAKAFKRPVARLAVNQLQREGKPIVLNYGNAMCVSDYVRQRLVAQGLISAQAVVVYNGVDLQVFSPKRPRSYDLQATGLRCLIAGRVIAHKGIHTVIDAFAELNHQSATAPGISLTILGDGPADYMALLKEKVQTHQLQGIVTFEPPIPRDQMPNKFMDYDALMLSSEYAEPIARSMQEAMAMGLLVIGTTTGGSGELLVHEQTGLVFEAGNARSLALQLECALSQPELTVRMAQAGQVRVRNAFRIDLTVSNVETYLQNLVEQD